MTATSGSRREARHPDDGSSMTSWSALDADIGQGVGADTFSLARIGPAAATAERQLLHRAGTTRSRSQQLGVGMPTVPIRRTTRVQAGCVSPPGTGSAITQAMTSTAHPKKEAPITDVGLERPHYLPSDPGCLTSGRVSACRHLPFGRQPKSKHGVLLLQRELGGQADDDSELWLKKKDPTPDDGSPTTSWPSWMPTSDRVSACRHSLS
jgi:hypothetical protein